MCNSVYLKPLEQHCHRFLWRYLKTDHAPDVYVMTRVNMGDILAPAISTDAIYKTAYMFESDSPKARGGGVLPNMGSIGMCGPQG